MAVKPDVKPEAPPLILLKAALIQRLMMQVYGRKMTEEELVRLRRSLTDDAVTRMLQIMGQPPEKPPKDLTEAIMDEESGKAHRR